MRVAVHSQITISVAFFRLRAMFVKAGFLPPENLCSSVLCDLERGWYSGQTACTFSR